METNIENTAAPSVEVPRLVRLRCPKCGASSICWLDKDDPPWSHEETAEIRTSCFECIGGERKPMTYHREDGSEICKPNDLGVPPLGTHGGCSAVPCSRFFIAQPGDLLGNLAPLQKWHEWEVGDRRGQDRICLTSCKRKAELIRDALEAFHPNN